MIIYKIENKINGHIYIGQTKQTLNARISSHLCTPLTSGMVVGKAFKKYGIESFLISIIDYAETKEVLNEKEKYWIKHYSCRGPNGYNLTDGGDGMENPSEETRKKLSAASKGRPSGMKGKHHSAETIQKMKNRHPSEEAMQKKRNQIPWNKGLTKEMDSRIKGSGRKGFIPWNKGTKGLQVAWSKGLILGPNPEHSKRMKGCIPPNKGKKGLQVAWNKGKSSWSKGLTKETDSRIKNHYNPKKKEEI